MQVNQSYKDEQKPAMSKIKELQRRIYYSERYEAGEYIFRHVKIPEELLEYLPHDRLMSEAEWRGIGIVQSPGWEHYMVHKPEPHIILFRRRK